MRKAAEFLIDCNPMQLFFVAVLVAVFVRYLYDLITEE